MNVTRHTPRCARGHVLPPLSAWEPCLECVATGRYPCPLCLDLIASGFCSICSLAEEASGMSCEFLSDLPTVSVSPPSLWDLPLAPLPAATVMPPMPAVTCLPRRRSQPCMTVTPWLHLFEPSPPLNPVGATWPPTSTASERTPIVGADATPLACTPSTYLAGLNVVAPIAGGAPQAPENRKP